MASYNYKQEHKYLFENTSFVTANSRYLANKLIALGCPSNKLKLVPIAVDTSLFTYVKRKEKPIVQLVSTGRLIPLKGHEFAIKMIKILVEQGSKIHYIIIGDGPLKDTLRSLVIELQLESIVDIVGKRNQQEICEILHKSDIFVMPSITDNTGRAEAFGLATIEAQATGLPVIAFNSGGLSETMIDKKTGYLIEERNIAKMATTVQSLLGDRDKRVQMGLNAKEWVDKNFEKKIVQKKMNGLILNALKNR